MAVTCTPASTLKLEKAVVSGIELEVSRIGVEDRRVK